LLVFAWLSLNWWLSSRPGSILAEAWYMAVLHNLAHAPLFGLLGLWFVLLIARRDGWPELTRGRATGVLLAVLAAGVVDELHQHFTPHRSMSFCDLITDVTGAAAVLLVVHQLSRAESSDRAVALRMLIGLLAITAAAINATYLPSVFPSVTGL
jgi:hypothetical protein